MKPINLKRASLAEYFYSLMDLLLSNLHFSLNVRKQWNRTFVHWNLKLSFVLNTKKNLTITQFPKI